jgi:hypothetical protein
MPGVGTVLAFTLIALPPELGKMSRKQIAALVGLFDTAAFTGVECRSIMFTGPPSAQAGIIPPSRPSPIASPVPTQNQGHHRRRHAKNDHNTQRYAPR